MQTSDNNSGPKARYANAEEFASEFGDFRVRAGASQLNDASKPITPESDQEPQVVDGLMGPVGGFNVDPTII